MVQRQSVALLLKRTSMYDGCGGGGRLHLLRPSFSTLSALLLQHNAYPRRPEELAILPASTMMASSSYSLCSRYRRYFSSMTDDLQHYARSRQLKSSMVKHGSNNGNSKVTDVKKTKTKYHLPKRIILLRHGESLGNIDETAYASIPDWRIPLTRRGERQAQRVAGELASLLKGESLFCYCSPYKRTMETWKIIEQHLKTDQGVEIIGMREEPRIAEQQFGNFQNPKKVRTAKSERRMFGRFFFRFPNGEAGLDVYNRVSSFLATLSRDIRQIDQLYSIRHSDHYYHHQGAHGSDDTTVSPQNDPMVQAATTYPLDDHILVENDCHAGQDQPPIPSPSLDSHVNSGQFPSLSPSTQPESDGDSLNCIDAMENMNILIVTHGLTLRLLLMRYFQLSVEEFEQSYNSQNARLVIMDRFVVSDESETGRLNSNRNVDDQREFYRLHEEAKEALNLKGDVSNEKPVYWRDSGATTAVGGLRHNVQRGQNHGWGSPGVAERELGGLWSLSEDDDIEE